MEKQNPFVFGKVVRGTDFCNRKEEIEKIKGIIHSKNNLVIISPRRYGKTSLVINALERNNIPFVFIDCFNISTEETLLERLTIAYLERLKKGDMVEKMKYLSKTLNIHYTFSVEGVSVKVEKYDDRSLDTFLKEISKEYVIVFDEFQELFALNANIVKRLRSILQFIKQSFIFLGSKKHLLLFLFSDQKSPFYNFASIMNLLKISPKEWTNFIRTKTEKTNVSLRIEDVDMILNYAEEIPFYVQYLAYHFWEERTRNTIISSTEIIKKILLSNAYVYEEIYSRLSISHRKALRIIAMQEIKRFSEDVLKRYNLKNPQLLNKSLNALEEKGVLDKNGEYHFNDPLFMHFITDFTKLS